MNNSACTQPDDQSAVPRNPSELTKAWERLNGAYENISENLRNLRASLDPVLSGTAPPPPEVNAPQKKTASSGSSPLVRQIDALTDSLHEQGVIILALLEHLEL